MIDLEKLKAAAEDGESPTTVVSRSWLAQALAEIAPARRSNCFGLKPGQSLW